MSLSSLACSSKRISRVDRQMRLSCSPSNSGPSNYSVVLQILGRDWTLSHIIGDLKISDCHAAKSPESIVETWLVCIGRWNLFTPIVLNGRLQSTWLQEFYDGKRFQGPTHSISVICNSSCTSLYVIRLVSVQRFFKSLEGSIYTCKHCLACCRSTIGMFINFWQ